MSKKLKRRDGIQAVRSVRSIREISQRRAVDSDYEINDGDEFQARDGSSVQTMAEAEAEERAETRALKLAQTPAEAPEAVDERTTAQILWSLFTGPARLLLALAKGIAS